MTSQCARVASWYATSDVADQAVPRPSTHHPALYGPVFLVADPTDLAPAQRRLARFLRPLHAADSAFTGEPEISAEAARHIVASQLFLCACFADIASKSPGGRTIKPAFLARIDLLKDIQPRLRYLVDVEPHTSSKPRMWQQGELTSAMTRMQRDARDLSLTRPELHELANATHEVTQNLGRVLRRELLRDTSNLRIADPTHQVGDTRVHRGTGLEARLTDLVNQPAPSHRCRGTSSPASGWPCERRWTTPPPQRRSPVRFPRPAVLARVTHCRSDQQEARRSSWCAHRPSWATTLAIVAMLYAMPMSRKRGQTAPSRD